MPDELDSFLIFPFNVYMCSVKAKEKEKKIKENKIYTYDFSLLFFYLFLLPSWITVIAFYFIPSKLLPTGISVKQTSVIEASHCLTSRFT